MSGWSSSPPKPNTEPMPTHSGAAPSSPASAGAADRHSPTRHAALAAAAPRPTFPSVTDGIAENPSSRSPRRSRARKRPFRISGWPDNPANPRRGTRPTPRFASAAEALSYHEEAKNGTPRGPRPRPIRRVAPTHAPPARPEPGAAGRVAPKRPSRISSATPRLIAASARLKTKKWRPNACRSRKSTTAP